MQAASLFAMRAIAGSCWRRRPGGAIVTVMGPPTTGVGLDAARFRHVIGHFMSGVAVVTARGAARDHGMTVSAISSLSLEPPMLVVCLNLRSPTQEAVRAGGAFAISVLRDGQDALAQRFASPHDNKFDGVDVSYGVLGQPLIDAALATLECEVVESVVGGTHRVFLARVRHATVRSGSPLAYYRGRFGRLEMEADARALDRLRRSILLRERPLDARLDPVEISAALGVPESSVEGSLAALAFERLVVREPDGYRQVPLDARRSDEAFDAKLVLDLGAARLAVERASDADLERLEDLARRSSPPASEDRTRRVEAGVAANEAFHEAAIGLAGNDALLLAYRRLSLPTVLAGVLLRDDEGGTDLALEHQAIARALRDRDLASAEHLIERHHEHGAEVHRRVIAAAGGRI